eukprot:TRINITY_DN784_c0_g3_i1.p1 TRINITY_DN784_c0_g3~~TRINITY_DN784_c0_g3_i1.p1  ORF type:complete len:223 (-),score=49.32 TRINITY_DN784_c0_g3_i1:121-789(-)
MMCEEDHLKLYCFANKYALGHSYLLLSIGDKVYADHHSLVGGFGDPQGYMNFHNTAKQVKLQIIELRSRENTLEEHSSPWKDPKDVNYDFLKRMNQERNSRALELLEHYRPNKFDQNRYAKEIEEGHVWTGQKAKEVGLVDELGSYEAILYKQFPGAILQDLTKKSEYERYWELFRRFVKIATLRGLPLIIALLLLKSLVKWSLILYVYFKAKESKPEKALQ